MSAAHVRCLLAGALLVLAACSGGGGGESPTAPAPGAPSIQQVEFDSFSLVNSARTANGVEPSVAFRDNLAQIAREHSRRMRDEDFFAHEDSEGRTVVERLQEAGISFKAVGENLATTTNISNPAAWAHDQLMASDDHRPNILSSRFSVIGVGVAREGNKYWITQVFIEP